MHRFHFASELTAYLHVFTLVPMPNRKTEAPMLAEQRRRKILDLIEQEGQITVRDLVKRFSMSAVTVRSDLDALGATGAIIRSHGGAVCQLEPTRDYPLRFKASLRKTEKTQISQAAVNLIQPGEVILLDSGSTTDEIARQIKARGIQAITVITDAINIVTELVEAPGVSVICIGGLLRPISHSFVGPQAEAMLKDLHADHLFLAVDGFDLEAGLTTPDVLEAQLNSVMMSVAKETTVVADYSKLGRRSVCRIGSVEQIHRLITDTKAPEDFVQALRARSIEVIQA